MIRNHLNFVKEVTTISSLATVEEYRFEGRKEGKKGIEREWNGTGRPELILIYSILFFLYLALELTLIRNRSMRTFNVISDPS